MQKLISQISNKDTLATLKCFTSEGLFADVLLDQVAHPNLLHDFFLQDRGEYAALFTGTPFDHIISMSPFLWRANEKPNDYLQFLISQEAPQITILISSAPFLLQKAHLQSLLEVFLPDGNCAHMRVYNDLVLQRLIKSFMCEDMMKILGPNAAVIYPNEVDEKRGNRPPWLLGKNPARGEPQHLVDTYVFRQSPWWQLRDEHFVAFAEPMRLVLIDNIVQDLWYRDTPHAAHINQQYGTIEEFVGSCIEEGQSFGLETYKDLQAYSFLMAEFESVSERKELATAIMIMASGAAPDTRMAELRATLEGRVTL
jgi:hypothetical protein